MDIAEAVAFVRENHHSVIQTFRNDGLPAMSPVLVSADDDGHLLISTREPTIKVKRLRRDPRCSLCVLADGFFGRWIHVEGRAEIIPLPDAMPILEYVYRQTAGEHPNWDEFRAAMETEQRVVLRITVERAGPDSYG
jgi:PPOX class probable F420-dependent enzyme